MVLVVVQIDVVNCGDATSDSIVLNVFGSVLRSAEDGWPAMDNTNSTSSSECVADIGSIASGFQDGALWAIKSRSL